MFYKWIYLTYDELESSHILTGTSSFSIKGHSHIREANFASLMVREANFASPRTCVYGVASTSGVTAIQS